MKKLLTFLTVVSLTLQVSQMNAAYAAESDLLPESIEGRSEITPAEKTLTIFIKEDDPEKLTALLNKSNQEYGTKGWSVFAITPYTSNGDMDGFFVTYCKGLSIE